MKQMGKTKRVKHTPGDKAADPRTDWDRVDSLTDEEVEAAAKSDRDNPPLSDADFERMKQRRPKSPGHKAGSK